MRNEQHKELWLVPFYSNTRRLEYDVHFREPSVENIKMICAKNKSVIHAIEFSNYQYLKEKCDFLEKKIETMTEVFMKYSETHTTPILKIDDFPKI